VTKSHVKMQFTVYRVNQGARLTTGIITAIDKGLTHSAKSGLVPELH
jgi:hypothetical protein